MPAEPTSRSRRSLRIGNYDVLAPLTLAPLGSLYTAEDVEQRRRVLLKVLPAELTSSIVGRDRFQREAHRARKIESPHVVRVLDFGEASGTWFLAMEMVEGRSLNDYIQQHGPLNPQTACGLLGEGARALFEAHRAGVVPPDLSAANFLIPAGADAPGRLTVKLVDLGLLRPLKDDVPGDVRTAIAGLGRTTYFLLTGRDSKPDLAALGPDVPQDLRRALRRMLTPRPEEGFATPAALLEALGIEEPGPSLKPEPASIEPSNLLSALAEGEAAAEGAEGSPRAIPRILDQDKGDDVPLQVRDDGPEGPTEVSEVFRTAKARRRTGPLLAVGGIVAVLAIVLVIAALQGTGKRPPSSDPSRGGRQVKVQPGDGGGNRGESPEGPGTKPEGPEKPPEGDGPKPPPPLYQPKVPIDWDHLRKEYEGPWAGDPPPPKDAVVFRVARLPSLLPDAKPGTVFDSVAAACAAAPAGKWTIVAIHDNGPFFEPPIAVAGRNLVVQGAGGFRPLLVWDQDRARKPGRADKPVPEERAPTFLAMSQGKLLLGDIDLAVRWPGGSAPPTFVRVAGGDLLAWSCTFSATSNKSSDPITVARFESGSGKKCRLSRCYGRGPQLVAVDVVEPGGEVLIDQCLWAGGDPPLLQATGGSSQANGTTLRVVRSTLLARDTLLALRAGPGAAANPSLRWMGWDALLARSAEGSGGVMVSLPPGSAATGIRWQAVNCAYGGWKLLLSGKEVIDGADNDAWHNFWQLSEGDVSFPRAWGTGLPANPSQEPALTYRTEGTPLAFQATFSPGYLGCDLAQLPWARPNWQALACERPLLPPVEMLDGVVFPEIPKAADQRYHGERLDLTRIDLGAHLCEVQKRQKLAPVVVLHLHGWGKCKTSPVFLQGAADTGTQFWLCFEPAPPGREPLELIPDPNVAPTQDALIQVEDGGLEMVGGDIRCPDFKTALVPHYLVMVSRGYLRLHGSRLQGPMSQVPDSFWALIRLEGSGFSDPKLVRGLTINESVLLSGRIGLHIFGIGARVRVQKSLLVAGGRAVQIQPGALVPPGLNVQLSLDHCTVAAREAAIYVEDTPAWWVLADPVYVQSTACAFLNPFPGAGGKGSHPATMLLYESVALPRGVLVWHGDRNLYDPRLHAYAVGQGADGRPALPQKPQPQSDWVALWGPLGDRQPIPDVPLKGTLDLEKLALEQLVLPAHPAFRKEVPGADLARLGVGRKRR